MAARQLSNGDDSGTVLGQDSADKIGFYGTTPIAKPAATVLGALTAGETTPADVAAALVDLRTQLVSLGLISNT